MFEFTVVHKSTEHRGRIETENPMGKLPPRFYARGDPGHGENDERRTTASPWSFDYFEQYLPSLPAART